MFSSPMLEGEPHLQVSAGGLMLGFDAMERLGIHLQLLSHLGIDLQCSHKDKRPVELNFVGSCSHVESNPSTEN